jgi:hypothetical protein
LNAKLSFKFCNARRDCWLRYSDTVGGFCETTSLDDRDKMFELIKFHKRRQGLGFWILEQWKN